MPVRVSEFLPSFVSWLHEWTAHLRLDMQKPHKAPVERGILFVRPSNFVARLRGASFSTARWRTLQCLPEIVH
jgi:hypothetical protein